MRDHLRGNVQGGGHVSPQQTTNTPTPTHVLKVDSRVINMQPKDKGYITVTMSAGGGFLVASGEGGSIFAIDPDTAEVYSFKYGGGGVGFGVSGGASIQIGVMYMTKPGDMSGVGFEFSLFAAAGPVGASAQLSGGGGTIGGSAGYSGGGGASVSGEVIYVSAPEKTNFMALPKEALKKLLQYTESHNKINLKHKIQHALDCKKYS